jgi:hypothetical protein
VLFWGNGVKSFTLVQVDEHLGRIQKRAALAVIESDLSDVA